MAASMVSHIRILNENKDYYTERYEPTALHPFDAVRVVLEQALFLRYLEMTSGYSDVGILKDFRLKILQDAASLPVSIQMENPDLETLYALAIATTKDMVSDQYAQTRLQHIELKPIDFYALFNTPLQQEYIHREYTPTITEDFLSMILALDYGWYDEDLYKDGKLHDGAIYLPSVASAQIYHPEMKSVDNKDFRLVVSLTPRAIKFINLKIDEVVYLVTDIGWLRHFNFGDYTLDDLVGILANFSIDRSKYHMTNVSTADIRVPDVCYDLVTGSQYLSSVTAGMTEEKNCEYIFDVFKYLVTKRYIQPVKDLGLFGELLQRLGAPQDIVNYFIKPVNSISAAEAYAFRTSTLASFMDDRFIVGMEADNPQGDNPGGVEPSMEFEDDANENAGDTENDESGTDTNPTDALEGDTPEGDTEEETSAPKEKPHIDPDRMLLELANPNETMSDYIYREMVARRINTILLNPPQNARPNDLLMLKRWRSRWLYLVNISCLRDFLTRISLRLSDV